MFKNPTFCIGLMSGTSLDGVDLVYAKFEYSNQYSFQIIHGTTIAYPEKWLQLLKNAFYFNKKQLQELDVDYGNYLADLILNFIKQNDIKEIDFIASHGHTIHHKPEEGYTLQIGNGKTIANKTSIKTICDFRSQDVAFGGQGAPLVPIGDKLLFSKYKYCLNLGGFANISFDVNDTRIAFDIGAVNTVLNHYATKLGVPYDDNGTIAKSGSLISDLLNELNALDFYKTAYPKSLGFEYVDAVLIPLIDKYDASEKDILHTYVAHIAFQIAAQITNAGSVLITGGGVFNSYLISRIKFYTKNEIVIPDKNTIDFKEALIFAFLGLRKLENKINCLKSVTGASKNHSSGVVFLSEF